MIMDTENGLGYIQQLIDSLAGDDLNITHLTLNSSDSTSIVDFINFVGVDPDNGIKVNVKYDFGGILTKRDTVLTQEPQIPNKIELKLMSSYLKEALAMIPPAYNYLNIRYISFDARSKYRKCSFTVEVAPVDKDSVFECKEVKKNEITTRIPHKAGIKANGSKSQTVTYYTMSFTVNNDNKVLIN